MKQLPEAFKARMKAQLGADYGAFLACYELAPVRGIRINTLKMSIERFIELCPWKTEPSRMLDEGLILKQNVPHIGSHPYHIAGLFYVQEPTAMSVIEASDVEPGMRVLDLCAAPGGKSGGIAARMRGKGFLLSNEIVPSRSKQLARNLERLGVINSAVTCAHPDAIKAALPRFFDRVIVDAPCSGEGMFRKDDTAIDEWSEEHVASCAARQRAILESAEGCVAPGGRLIYSTCTFSAEENEGVIEAFLNAHPEYLLVSSKRLYPHVCEGEGHFVAVLEKGEAFASEPLSIRKLGVSKRTGQPAGGLLSPALLNKGQRGIAFDFLTKACVFENDLIPKESLFAFSNKLLYIPFDIPSALSVLRIVSLGVEVGEFSKGRLKPSHTFFMAAHGFEYNSSVDFDEESRALAAFLRGEALDEAALDARSFRLLGEYSRYMPVCVRGAAVGFGKLSDGMLKNHLPKGLISSRSGDGE